MLDPAKPLNFLLHLRRRRVLQGIHADGFELFDDI